MYDHIRAMMNPRWKEEERYPEKKALCAEIRQPAISSWLGKTQVMTMLTQTREQGAIRPKTCKETIIPKKKLQDRWKNRHKAIMGKH